MFGKKYKIIEFPSCKNENQVIKKLEDSIKHYNHISMIHTDNIIKIQTTNDRAGRDYENPYINLIGKVEFLNGKYALKYYFNNKVKYVLVAIVLLLITFISTALTTSTDMQHTLILTAILLLAGGVFALNNYLNFSYNITTIEDFLKKFGEIKKLQ